MPVLGENHETGRGSIAEWEKALVIPDGREGVLGDGLRQIGELRGVDLNSRIEWWWSIGISPMALWLVGSASFVVVVVLAFAQTAVRVNTPEPPPGEFRSGDDPSGDVRAGFAGVAEPSASQHQHVLPVERNGEVTRPSSEADGSTELETGLLDERPQ